VYLPLRVTSRARPVQLKAGDILLLPGNPRHVMRDGSGAAALNFTISENPGSGERLDLLCGHFAIAPPHDRLLRSYLPAAPDRARR
jgi:AraC family transcriptional activator of mtrCDE